MSDTPVRPVALYEVQFFPIVIESPTTRVTLSLGAHPIAARSADALHEAMQARTQWLVSPERRAA